MEMGQQHCGILLFAVHMQRILYKQGSVLGVSSGCTAFGRVIKSLNLDRYPGALLWMQKSARARQQFQKVFPSLFSSNLNVVPASPNSENSVLNISPNQRILMSKLLKLA